MTRKKGEKESRKIINLVKTIMEELHGPDLANQAFSSKSQKREHVNIRHVMFYFLVKEQGVPGHLLSEIFNKNHATIIWSCKKVQDYIDTEPIFVRDYITPLRETFKKYHLLKMPVREYIVLANKWFKMNLYDELKQITEDMEEKAYNMMALINDVENDGYRITRNPDTILVPSGTKEEELSMEITILRKTYGFMVQTEIV